MEGNLTHDPHNLVWHRHRDLLAHSTLRSAAEDTGGVVHRVGLSTLTELTGPTWIAEQGPKM